MNETVKHNLKNWINYEFYTFAEEQSNYYFVYLYIDKFGKHKRFSEWGKEDNTVIKVNSENSRIEEVFISSNCLTLKGLENIMGSINERNEKTPIRKFLDLEYYYRSNFKAIQQLLKERHKIKR